VSAWATTVRSPVGVLDLVADDDGAVTHLLFDLEQPWDSPWWSLRHDPRPFDDVVAQLEEYFAGERTLFDVPLAPRGTAFQRAAWDALRAIPYGRTSSYVAQARAIGRPSAARAVGAANGRNPIAIVLPCHRVVGASGSLTGYGGGLDRKRWLLEHERRHVTADRPTASE
jgi:methylated-DNA-[protein]-cysteine S-methyltransferase